MIETKPETLAEFEALLAEGHTSIVFTGSGVAPFFGELREGDQYDVDCGIAHLDLNVVLQKILQSATLRKIKFRGCDGIDQALVSLPRLENQVASLDLNGCGVSEVGTEAMAKTFKNLTSLAMVSAPDKAIGDAGTNVIAEILTRLKSLDLRGNKITEIGANSIAQSLTGLTSLDLRHNQIGDNGAKAIAQTLTNLTSLSLASNNISDTGAKAVAMSLTGLTSLEFDNNTISDVGAKSIAQSLTGLTSLNLRQNTIGDMGVKAIAQSLTELTSLSLGQNTISDVGATIIAQSLPKLTTLYLGKNTISNDGAKIIAHSLSELTLLDLGDCVISDIGAKVIAQSLPGLTKLYLEDNRIGQAGLESVLTAFASSSALSTLYLKDNPGCDTLLTPEVFDTFDAQSTLAAWRAFKEAKETGNLTPLNEAKLLVVGDEAVGKTSLIKFMLHNKHCNPKEKKTPGVSQHEGIETDQWHPDGGDIRLNVWDFGGQEIMHGTHRYFLTERSLYLLVLSDRKEDDRPERWLRIIESLAGASPVILVINKSDEGKTGLRLDEQDLQRRFPQIVTVLRTSCENTDWSRGSIDGLRTAIAGVLYDSGELEHIRKPIPEEWLAVKQEITRSAKNSRILKHDKFTAICQNRKIVKDRPITDPATQTALLRLLHELGVIVAHGLRKDAPAAEKEITLLDPNWLTGAIYAVLNSSVLKDKGGIFSRADLAAWLDPKIYPPERHEFIISMMLHKDVELCFRLPGQQEAYLAPEALAQNSRDYTDLLEGTLRFRYRYSHLPKSLIPRFIVRTHEYLTESRDVWHTGVVLKVGESMVYVIGNIDLKTIDVAVKGKRARDALTVIRGQFDQVHKIYEDIDIMTVVPMPDDPDVEESYEYLLQLETEEGRDYRHRPTGAKASYRVGELLDNISDTSRRSGASKSTNDALPTPSTETGIAEFFGKLAKFPVNIIFPAVAAFLAALVAFTEIRLGTVYSACAAALTFGLIWAVMRFFDRGFLFRRSFLTWLGLGVGLLGLQWFHAGARWENFFAEVGKELELFVGVIWFLTLIVLAGLAALEGQYLIKDKADKSD